MVVVPVFYGTYTALGLVNTIIYLDEIGNYPGWAIALVFIGIGVLVYGVYLLSSKPDPSHNPDHEDQENDHSGDNHVDQEHDVIGLDPNRQHNDDAVDDMPVIHHTKSWPSAHDEKNEHGRLFHAASSPSLTFPQQQQSCLNPVSHSTPTTLSPPPIQVPQKSRIPRWFKRRQQRSTRATMTTIAVSSSIPSSYLAGNHSSHADGTEMAELHDDRVKP